MRDSEAAGVFKNKSSAFIAIWLEDALERVVKVGLDMRRRKVLSQYLMELGLEDRGELIIDGLLRAFNPEVFWNIRGIDSREVWRAYWDLRKGGKHVSIFEFIIEINTAVPSIRTPN